MSTEAVGANNRMLKGWVWPKREGPVSIERLELAADRSISQTRPEQAFPTSSAAREAPLPLGLRVASGYAFPSDGGRFGVLGFGDDAKPISTGVVSHADIRVGLYELCKARIESRHTPEDVTVFRNGGDHLDLTAAAAFHARTLAASP